MARKVNITLESDLSQAPADTTIEFGFDGVSYAIDLTTEEADAFRGVMEKYVAVGTKVGRPSKSKRRPKHTTSVDTAAVRAWAAENGLPTSARGRVPAEVMEKYLAAHPAS